jgi:hypothetical protein
VHKHQGLARAAAYVIEPSHPHTYTLRGMAALPDWPRGTPALLCTNGPHAIPVSTALRGGDARIVFALGSGRETLSILRRDPRSAICVLAEGAAFTAYGSARVVREQLEAAPHVVALELLVDEVEYHLADSRTEMLDGARWRWTDAKAADEEPLILEELAGL